MRTTTTLYRDYMVDCRPGIASGGLPLLTRAMRATSLAKALFFTSRHKGGQAVMTVPAVSSSDALDSG